MHIAASAGVQTPATAVLHSWYIADTKGFALPYNGRSGKQESRTLAGKEASRWGEFAVLLRKYREAANLTQEELAEHAGLSVKAISALERGQRRSPRPSTVGFLATALQLDAPRKATLIAAARGWSVPAAPLGETSDPSSAAADRLVDADELVASMPMETLPPRGPMPAGSRMPLAPNPLFVGRGDELLHVAAALRGG